MFRRSIGLALGFLPLLACAQGATLKLPNFDHLQKIATDSVDVTLGHTLLGFASRFADQDDPDQKDMKEMLSGLKEVQVRSFKFNSDFAYSEADIDAVRSQLKAPGWSPLVQVHNRKDHEHVDIFVALDGDHANGIAIVTSEPREFTIVNIVGRVDLDKLGKLEDRLGLPGASVETKGKADSGQ
jgi:Domain of unknown function (DUF4252)